MKEGIFKNIQIRDFVISGDKLVAGADGIYLSEDEGTTWTKQNTSVTSVNAISAVDNTVYVSDGQLLHISRDNGSTWTTSSIGAIGGPYFMSAIYALGDEVYIGASSGDIFYSQNEGLSWIVKSDLLINNRHNSILENNGSLLLSTNSGIFYSADAGNSWEERNKGITNHIIQDLETHSGKIYAGTASGLHISNDQGNTWVKKINGNTNLGYNETQGIYVKNNEVYIGNSNGVFKSTDGGASWIQKLVLGPNKQVQVLEGNGNKIIAAEGADGVYVSSDNGENWNLKTSSLFAGNLFSCGLVKGDTLILGGNESIYISTDFGETWTVSKVIPSYFYPNAIAYFNSRLIVCTFQGIFQSSNLGLSWNRLGNLSVARNCNDLLINPAGHFYVGTDLGVYVSYDQGLNWYPVNNGMENISVYILALAETHMVAGTYGMSVWKCPLDKLNVTPAITGVKTVFSVTNEETVAISPGDLDVFDPDNVADDFTLQIATGDNYTVSENVITPSLDFVGLLSIPVQVNDGNSLSNTFQVEVEVLQVVGVENPEKNFHVFPNPSRDKVFINTNSESLLTVNISDNSGRTIAVEGFLKSNEAFIDVSKYPSGFYFVEIRTDKKVRKVKLLRRD